MKQLRTALGLLLTAYVAMGASWFFVPGSGEPPFSPTDIPSLLSWHDAGQGVSTSGSDITDWADQSGNGIDCTPPGGAEPTLVSAELNGRPVARFNGSSDYCVYDSFTSTRSSFTWSAVIKSVNRAQFDVVFAYNTGSTGSGLNIGSGNNSLAVWVGGSGQSVSAAFSANTWYIVQITKNFATTTLTQYQNGSQVAQSTFSNAVMFSANNMGWATGFGFWDGDIAEVLTFSEALSTENRGLIETYLNNKYAVY